jgi:mono/diheme cytochrome c family protein/catechol 2,3-dioxygenase-like lactoylglutathione lyase family enzyme
MTTRMYGLAALVGAAFLGVLAFLVIDVSGEAEPSWLEREVAFQLLRARVESAPFPSQTLADSDVKRSTEIYQQRCGLCHGNINGQVAPFARTLSPRPPQFLTTPPRGSAALDAYIIRHGIRWTGMPAFKSMSETDARRLALFIHRASSSDTRQRLATFAGDPFFGIRPFLAGIYVPNARDAADWYRRELGFTVDGESTDSAGRHQVVVERGPYAVELLEGPSAGYGIAKLGFVVDDLEPVLRQLTQRRVRLVQGLTTLPAFDVRFILIKDNNGNVIQIFDRNVHR